MSTFFCGNPFNHGPHDTDLGQCAGVGRQEVKDEEVVVEEYQPRTYPIPPEKDGVNLDFMKGWKNGHDLIPEYPGDLVVVKKADYYRGYEAALRYKLEKAEITPNKARELMGLKPFDPETVGKEWDSRPLPNGEIRTVSETGGMKGVKPERYSLIPVEALDIMARLYGFGAEKYEAHNWRKGYEWSKSFDSLFRHATQALNGEDIDPETGLPHLAGAAFHCFTLMVFMLEHPEYDDRWKKPELPAVE